MLTEAFADCAKAFAESHNNKVAMKSEEEGFSSVRGYPLMMNESMMSLLGRVAAMVVAILLIALFGEFLWNNHITKLFSFAKTSKSVFDMIALYVFVRLVVG
jgi:hypothetical protein